jgi:hypothetical protein
LQQGYGRFDGVGGRMGVPGKLETSGQSWLSFMVLQQTISIWSLRTLPSLLPSGELSRGRIEEIKNKPVMRQSLRLSRSHA